MRQADPCLYTVTWWGVVSCVCRMLYSSVTEHWSNYHCFKQTPSWYHLGCLKVTVYPNKQTHEVSDL